MVNDSFKAMIDCDIIAGWRGCYWSWHRRTVRLH